MGMKRYVPATAWGQLRGKFEGGSSLPKRSKKSRNGISILGTAPSSIKRICPALSGSASQTRRHPGPALSKATIVSRLPLRRIKAWGHPRSRVPRFIAVGFL